MAEDKIAVIYLMWLPYDISLMEGFLRSYSTHTTKRAHQLIILFNGVLSEKQIQPHLLLLEKYQVQATYKVMEKGQDIEAYLRMAETVDAEILLFFNTYSLILADKWLEMYMNKFDSSVGVIGATASNQSYYSAVFETTLLPQKDLGIRGNIRKYKLLLKAFFYWRFLFKPFPNPHLRSNAFAIRRNLLLQIEHKPIRTKFSAYLFESGRNSMSIQAEKLGYRVLVVDRFGKTYDKFTWKESNTCWRGKQENLLISDNHTRRYETASEAEQRIMTRAAWGE